MADARSPRQRVLDACYEFIQATALLEDTPGFGFDEGQAVMLVSARKKLDAVWLEAVRDGI